MIPENTTAKPRLAIVINSAAAMLNFRAALIEDAVADGFEVFAFAPDYSDADKASIAALGARAISFRLDRTGRNVLSEMATIWDLARLFRTLRIEIVLSCFVKPAIYGSFAAKIVGVPHRLAMIEGLGFSFTSVPGKAESTAPLGRLVAGMLRLSLRHCRTIFVLNRDDEEFLVRLGAAKPGALKRLHGIGVELDAFPPSNRPTSSPLFTFIGRILREKGVYEFVEAARGLRARHPSARFRLLGGIDINPGAISATQVQSWVDEGLIDWRGHVSDVRTHLTETSVFVLPSWREGMPRSTQEAMAAGLPVITTDAPGARETVVEGKNGFKVPVGNPDALGAAMARFIEEPGLINEMGKESRRLAELWFDVRVTNRTIMEKLRPQKAP